MNEYILAVFNIFLKIIKSQSCLQTESCERKQQAKKKNKQTGIQANCNQDPIIDISLILQVSLQLPSMAWYYTTCLAHLK